MSRNLHLAVTAALVLCAVPSRATPPTFTVPHSGMLLDAQDLPVTNPGLTVSFRIYDTAAPTVGETIFWQATCAVVVRAGYYATTLGADCGDPLDRTTIPVGQERYLELAIGSTTLVPRQRLGLAPGAALSALSLDAERLGGDLPATYHDASRLTGTVPAAALGAGSTTITTVGTITQGTWQGTPIADAAIASAPAWNAKLSAETDPTIASQLAGKWCSSDGTHVNCTNDSPSGTVGLAAGTFQNATITVDAQGRITAISATLSSPLPFAFASLSGVATSTLTSSAIVQLTGFWGALPISVSGGGSPSYRICADATCSTAPAFTTAAGTVTNNQWVQVRLTSAAAEGAPVTATLTAGGASATFTVTTGDTTPNAFSFTNVTGAAVNTTVTSSAVAVSGFTVPLTATATAGATVSKDGTTFASSVSGVVSGDSLYLRTTSSASTNTAVTATVTLGGTTSGTWSVTTAAASGTNLATGSYTGKSYTYSPQITGASGIAMRADGLAMYISDGNATGEVYQYNLSTAWDLSTASYSGNHKIVGFNATPEGIFAKPDGTALYVMARGGSVDQYSMPQAWNAQTLTYDNKSFNASATNGTNSRGVFLSPDGLRMYLNNNNDNKVYQYALSTAWNVSTASYTNKSFTTTQGNTPMGVWLTSTGTRMYVWARQFSAVYQYTLSTAWDVSTASYSGASLSVAAQDTNGWNFTMSPDSTRLYFVGGVSPYTVFQYALGP